MRGRRKETERRQEELRALEARLSDLQASLTSEHRRQRSVEEHIRELEQLRKVWCLNKNLPR